MVEHRCRCGAFDDRAVSTCRKALDLARKHLPGLVISDDACERVDDLDEALESGTWGTVVWRALRALDAYSRIGGGFYVWCTTSGDPLVLVPRSLAMAESEAVLNDARMRAERDFPVSLDVDRSGEVLMQSHVNVERIGSIAPRLYFYDDTGFKPEGSTSAISVPT